MRNLDNLVRKAGITTLPFMREGGREGVREGKRGERGREEETDS